MKMKQNIKHRLLIASVSFLGFLSFLIIVRKFFSDRGVGPLSWQEIYQNLFFFIMHSLFFAVFVFFGVSRGKDKKEK